MKLPALWLAAASAAGIELVRWQQASLRLCVCAVMAALIISSILLWRRRVTAAWVFALITWAALGSAVAAMERVSVPRNSVGALIAAGHLDISSPLRWQGRLRSDPAQRPWGTEYLIDLEKVELPDAVASVHGGLRVTLYGDYAASDAPADLRAGDRVEALVKAQAPRNFRDPGAFDRKEYLATQGVDLTGSLRNARLLTPIDRPTPGWRQRLSRLHGTLLARVDQLFGKQTQTDALLRAMLLGDRSFVDTDTVAAFQSTSAYHVLVVAGLHTGALVAFLLWLCRRMRLGTAFTILVTLAALVAYVGVVEDRPPIFRAALMATIYLLARPLFRRIDLLNVVALAALTLLLWTPSLVADSSFALSFLAAGVIAGLAVPWMERTSAPYRAGLAHLGDVTRDVVHPPKIAQFRLESRAAARWLAARLPKRIAPRASVLVSAPIRLGLRLGELFLLSLTIQLGMLPLLAADFHRVSLSGPVSNIPAVLLTGIIVPLGFLCLAVSCFWTRVAILLARALGSIALLLLHSVGWFARLPHMSYRIPGPPPWLTLAFFVALAALAALARRSAAQRAGRIARRKLPPPVSLAECGAAIAVAALALLVATYPFRPSLGRGKTEVTVLDVGQGDSIFVGFPNGQTMLVDGGGLAGSEWMKGMRSGPDIGEEVVSPYLWSRGLKRLDVVALTHAHEDHLGGLLSVLENFYVGELWIGRDEDTAAFTQLLREAKQRGVRVVHKTQGVPLAWGGVHGSVLWPPVEEPVREASNDDSLVMRIQDGANTFLLTGDIEAPEERDILGSGAALDSIFLKVPHHGSKTSSTEPFLAAVQPRIAVVSVGEGNAYGHPSESVVERYAAESVRLLRTDRDGAVTVSSDGRSIALKTFVNATPETLTARAIAPSTEANQ